METIWAPLFLAAGIGLLHADVPAFNLVFMGDSITAGGGTDNHQTQAAPVVAVYYLARDLGTDAVYASNQGHPGHTTTDFLPGGQDLPLVKEAVKALQAQHPGQLVFPVMLGTNDCANSGPNGAPVAAETYEKNLHATIDALLAEYPAAKIVLNRPIWFSPNTHNGADYEGRRDDSLGSRLSSPPISSAAKVESQYIKISTVEWRTLSTVSSNFAPLAGC